MIDDFDPGQKPLYAPRRWWDIVMPADIGEIIPMLLLVLLIVGIGAVLGYMESVCWDACAPDRRSRVGFGCMCEADDGMIYNPYRRRAP